MSVVLETLRKGSKKSHVGFSSLLFSGWRCASQLDFQKGKRLKPFCISGGEVLRCQIVALLERARHKGKNAVDS